MHGHVNEMEGKTKKKTNESRSKIVIRGLGTKRQRGVPFGRIEKNYQKLQLV